MSWDLLAYRETRDENGRVTRHSLGEWSDVKALVGSQLDVEWEGPFWCSMSGDGYSIEINVGNFDSREGDPVKDISFEVRGGGDPLPVIADFCRRHNLTLHDLATGADINPDNPSDAGFEAFQAHRDAAVERAGDRHGSFVDETTSQQTSFAEAVDNAKRSGYLRDQPFAHMAYTTDEYCNNFVAWNDELLFTGAVKEDAAGSWQADLDAKGFYYIPDDTVRAPGPPLWYEKITRIEVDQDRPGIRVRGRDTKGGRRSYSIRFADDDRKQAFVETLVGNIGRPHRREDGVSPGAARLLVVPFIFAALLTAIGFWLFSASTAKWIAIAMAALFALVSIGAIFGKPSKADHYIYAEHD